MKTSLWRELTDSSVASVSPMPKLGTHFTDFARTQDTLQFWGSRAGTKVPRNVRHTRVRIFDLGRPFSAKNSESAGTYSGRKPPSSHWPPGKPPTRHWLLKRRLHRLEIKRSGGRPAKTRAQSPSGSAPLSACHARRFFLCVGFCGRSSRRRARSSVIRCFYSPTFSFFPPWRCGRIPPALSAIFASGSWILRF